MTYRIRGEVRKRGVQPDLARDRAIAKAYRGGATMEDISKFIGISKSGIEKALKRRGEPRRPRGVVAKIPETIIVGSHRALYSPDPQRPVMKGTPPPRVWCVQCERNVLFSEADQCRSQWCKAQAEVAKARSSSANSQLCVEPMSGFAWRPKPQGSIES